MIPLRRFLTQAQYLPLPRGVKHGLRSVVSAMLSAPAVRSLFARAPTVAAFWLQTLPHRLREQQVLCRFFGLDLTVNLADELGWTIYYSGKFEQQELNLLQRLVGPESRVFDVGANYGTHSLVAAGTGATVYAFEPSRVVLPYLRQNLAQNSCGSRVTVVETAIAAQDGTIEFAETERDLWAIGSIAHSAMHGRTERYSVLAETLATSVERYGIPTLVKLDIEGLELEVLSASQALLSRRVIRYLLVEVHTGVLKALGRDSSELFKLMTDCGYEATKLPVPQIEQNPTYLFHLEPLPGSLELDLVVA